jgi:putative endonuclease
MWQVYVLECADGTFYTGITTDIKRRLAEHNESDLGAKYTRGRRPVKLVFLEETQSRSSASSLEQKIKKMTRREKGRLIDI